MTDGIIKRINNQVFQISQTTQQITVSDSRYYKIKDNYYPSITYILQYYPKGPIFEDWLKKVGYAADFIVKKASEEGTIVHALIEQYLNDDELKFFGKNHNPLYSIEVWKMFLRFVEFWEKYKPKLINQEIIVYSDELKIAGTCDLICEINDQIWVIDYKSSNQLQTVYELQTAIYSKCIEELYNIKPERYGILWLKSSKRKEDKSGNKIQGKGWELKESERSYEENIELFKTVKKLFDIENPNQIPNFVEFKTSIKKNF